MTQTEHDVVQLLTNQHEEIRRLFDLVENSPGEAREQAFDSLRAYLAVHETAEEEVVHPYARQTMESSGTRTIDPILEEEKDAKATLRHLERVGTKSPEFLPLFRDFRKAVEAHAEHEEQNEFPRLRANGKPEELRGMADLVRAAEAVAPTRAHPGTESAVKNLLVGPFASMSDRVRDAIKSARR